ncbi:MAG: uroporphyrinogen-III decarboxylase-like protein [Anaerolineae bacterium]|nr:uroporphyrinogen-III decarboxylase-like protein [Anaerolineae bacterium]
MPKETMTPKERWLAVLTRKQPDRLPMDYWATEEATQKLMAFLDVGTQAEMYRVLHIDRLVTVGPAYVGPPIAEDVDMYGCRFRDVQYKTGVYREVITHPLARYETAEEVAANYTWPTVDWFNYSGIPAQVEGRDDYAVRGGGSEPFLTYCQLRGLEQAYMDLVMNPEMVHYCLDQLFDFCYENTTRIYEAIPGRVNVSYVAEDMGSQESLLFSPKQIHEFLIPRMKRMIDLAHSAGAYAFFHSDGAVRRIIPDMIEAGIDVLNPIQWRCKGMERKGLKRDFGDRIVFHGGVDNQQTLPFGTVADVREEVAANIEILGEGGGYIIAPCHNIQANTPPENVVAMYETGYAQGWT